MTAAAALAAVGQVVDHRGVVGVVVVVVEICHFSANLKRCLKKNGES